MTGVIEFKTKHGPIRIEVDEAVLPTTGSKKGAEPMNAREPKKLVAIATTSFAQATDMLYAYTANIQDALKDLDIAPKDVAIELNLKFIGEAGFVIAKAGTEAEFKILISWTPAA